jgi:hypothetical protein
MPIAAVIYGQGHILPKVVPLKVIDIEREYQLIHQRLHLDLICAHPTMRVFIPCSTKCARTCLGVTSVN